MFKQSHTNTQVPRISDTPVSITSKKYRSPADILADHNNELTMIALEVGIDWHRIQQQQRSFPFKITQGIAAEKKYQGKVVAYGELYRCKNGIDYPVITFHTVKHGGITETWSGYEAEHSDPFVTKRQPTQPKRVIKKAERREQDQQADQQKIQRFNKFQTEFKTLPRVTESAYLARHGINISDIPADFDLRQGTDYRGAYIAYALRNQSNKEVGFQKIYEQAFTDKNNNTRDKDFIFMPDSLKGSCAVIFPPLDESKTASHRLDIAEGLAVALASFIACGKPCAIALSANNLLPVARRFGAYNLRLLADNDIHSSGRNTGLFMAAKVAKETGASVVMPELPSGEKCDFNDVLVQLGPKEFARQLRDNKAFDNFKVLDFHIAEISYAPQNQLKKAINAACFSIARSIYTVEQYKNQCQQISIAALKRGVARGFVRKAVKRMFIKHSLTPIQTKHAITDFEGVSFKDATDLSNQQLADFMLKRKGIFVDARGMGTGKTEVMHLLSDYTKALADINERKVVYISPLMSLTSTGAQRLSLQYYKHIQTDFGQISEKLAVCINSIPSHSITDANMLLVDEFRQMLEFIYTGTVDNREEVLACLIETINAAETIVFADADFNDFTLNWLKENTNKAITVIKAKPATHKKSMTILPDFESLLSDAAEVLRLGKNIWLTCDSKIQVAKSVLAFELLGDSHADDFLVITGDNKGDEKQLAFLANPNEESKKYRGVIASPVISCGVSITNDHFSNVYGLFSNVISANGMMQTVGRVRQVDDIKVAFKNGHIRNRETNPQHLINGDFLKDSRFLNKDTLKIAPMAFYQSKIKANLNDSLNNFHREFLILAQTKGYTVRATGTAVKIAGLSKRSSELDAQRILNAELISDEKFKELKQSKPDTQKESDSFDRALVAEMAGKPADNIDEDDVEFYKDGGMTSIRNYELISSEIEEIKANDRKLFDSKKETHGDTSRALFMQYVIEYMTNREENEFSERDIKKLMDYLQKNHVELTANNLGSFEYIGRPIAKLKNLLKKMGYIMWQAKRNSSERFYSFEGNAQVIKYVANRKALKLANCEDESDTLADYV